MLTAGIIGLPNVGKSTLFNALVGAHRAAVESYPFCTIEPNVGVVTVPDPRVDQLAQVVGVGRKVYGVIEFVDIAGLIEGASKGEGLGNRFLSHVREVDALVHVVRCFEDPDVPHVPGAVDPVRDVEIIQTELILADLESVDRQLERARKEARRRTPEALRTVELLEQIRETLDQGRPASVLSWPEEDARRVRSFFLLTNKPQIFVANVGESDLERTEELEVVRRLKAYAEPLGIPVVVLSAGLEEQLVDLSPEEATEYLSASGVKERGTDDLIRATCTLLGQITFFTFNEEEVRAWLIRAGTHAAEAAGKIHTDMEKGFIRAEVVPWDALVEAGSVSAARAAGHYRVEGRDYIVQDGDVILIHFRD